MLLPRLKIQLVVHYVRDGLWKMRNLSESNLISPFLKQDGDCDVEGLLKWFSQDLEFNKIRLEQVEKTGDLRITDPTKVRIKRIKQGEPSLPKKEGKTIFH